MLERITPLILTYNEAPNIARTLDRLRWARKIIVLDSFSSDQTLEIAASFPNVQIHQLEFYSHERQWNFGLRHSEIETDWVLALDADYIVPEELLIEIQNLEPQQTLKGYRANVKYCVNGKVLRSGIYPRVTVLYRRESATYRQNGHTQEVVIDGPLANLRSPILHDDRKSLSRWFHSQRLYTELEVAKLLTAESADLSWSDRIRRLRLVAPIAMLFYCLLLRGGLLDGQAGIYYALQRVIAELMLSLQLLDHDLRFGFARNKGLRPDAIKRRTANSREA